MLNLEPTHTKTNKELKATNMKICGIIDPIMTHFENEPSGFFRYVQRDMLEILGYLVPKYGYDMILTSPDSRFDKDAFLAARKYKATAKTDLLVMACMPAAPSKASRLYTPLNTILTGADAPEGNRRKLVGLCNELLLLATLRDLADGPGPIRRAILCAQKRQVTVRTIMYTTEDNALRLHF